MPMKNDLAIRFKLSSESSVLKRDLEFSIYTVYIIYIYSGSTDILDTY